MWPVPFPYHNVLLSIIYHVWPYSLSPTWSRYNTVMPSTFFNVGVVVKFGKIVGIKILKLELQRKLVKLQNCYHLRGHLKSSHIADKRKNFHMALYPSLPPSSNESVIDNGSIVWQMAMHIILVLPNNLPKQCRSHAGTLPWRFSIHALIAKWTKEKSQTVEKRYDFYFCFCFCMFKSGWPV